MKTIEKDIVIIGGGIAGLWLLRRLKSAGYHPLLLESNTLGGAQTHKAQGIIHGGLKYALQGALTEASHAIADMPRVWANCLNGSGEINLQNVRVLSPHQYLWSPHLLQAKLAGFFANLTLQGKVSHLKQDAYPQIFQHPDFKGQVYALDEMVLDVNSLLQALVLPETAIKITPFSAENFHWDTSGQLTSLTISHPDCESVDVKAQRFIFTAGDGNELLFSMLQQKSLQMQRRPLHMVLVKINFAETLYAHCLSLSATPRLTITTHFARDGKTVWYLGGQLAEEGVHRDCATQIQVAQQELTTLFPWLNFQNAEFATFYVDRAEPWQSHGKRPDSSFVTEVGNCIVGWPTKLALAPKLAADILQKVQQAKISPHADFTLNWPHASLAPPIWEQLL